MVSSGNAAIVMVSLFLAVVVNGVSFHDLPVPKSTGNCNDILPAVTIGNVRIDTAQLLQFANCLPVHNDPTRSKSVVQNALHHCKIEDSINGNIGKETKSFRNYCRAVRRTVDELQDANGMELHSSAVVRAALALVRSIFEKHKCSKICPCKPSKQLCSTMVEDGSCNYKIAESKKKKGYKKGVLNSMSDVEKQPKEKNGKKKTVKVTNMKPKEKAIKKQPNEETAKTQPKSDTPREDKPKEHSNKSPPKPISPVQMSQEDGYGAIDVNEEDSKVVQNDQAAAARKFKRRKMSVSAISLLTVAGVMIGVLMIMSAVYQISYQRFHADEIEQWRTAFRVVD